jgi:hypothetical protein
LSVYADVLSREKAGEKADFPSARARDGGAISDGGRTEAKEGD